MEKTPRFPRDVPGAFPGEFPRQSNVSVDFPSAGCAFQIVNSEMGKGVHFPGLREVQALPRAVRGLTRGSRGKSPGALGEKGKVAGAGSPALPPPWPPAEASPREERAGGRRSPRDGCLGRGLLGETPLGGAGSPRWWHQDQNRSVVAVTPWTSEVADAGRVLCQG